MKIFRISAAAVLLLAAVSAQTPVGRTVVIDPGHGGLETGAKGRFGNLEKDITLAISLKLKAMIEKDMGFEVVLTRDRDVDVPMETRSGVANNHKAALFISIHANGAVQKKAAGSETFFWELIEENWVTRDVALEEVEKVMDKEARGFSKEFKTEMKEGREIYEKVKAFGLPILVKDYTIAHGLGGIEVLEVKKMEKKELGDEVFLPPKGYQRIIPEPAKK